MGKAFRSEGHKSLLYATWRMHQACMYRYAERDGLSEASQRRLMVFFSSSFFFSSYAVRHLHRLTAAAVQQQAGRGGMQKVGGWWVCTWEAKPGGCRPRAARALPSCVALPAPQNLAVYPCSCASALPHPSNSSRVLHTTRKLLLREVFA